ncbi:MAG: hypothetical protein QNJ54_08395 [Prochloraceae cyanobacterium]|nr:hypothetical protein [Prochloraceae cyanobacterium]
MADMRGQQKETGIEVVHATAGRVRLRSRGASQQTLRTAAQQLKQQEGVYQVKLNENTGSLVVNFDVASVSLSSLLLTLPGYNCNSRMFSPSSLSKAKSSSANSFQKVSGEVIERLIPLTSGILMTRTLGIGGWLSLPIYIATAAITREMLQQLPPLVEKEQEKDTEKRQAEEESTEAEEKKEKEVDISQFLTLALAAKAFSTPETKNVELEDNSATGNSSGSRPLEENLNGHRSVSVETIEPDIKEETNSLAPVFSEEEKSPLNKAQLNGLCSGYNPSILWSFLDSIAKMPDLSTEVMTGG